MVATLWGQHNTAARLAQAYERGGNFEAALEIYLKQYAAGQVDYGIIFGIKKCYTELHRYPQLVNFLQQVLQKQPGNINVMVELGGAYYLNQQKEQALQQWNSVLQHYKNNAGAYRLVARKMAEYRLLDEAVHVYQKAIDTIKNQQSLYRDMAYLRRAQLDYAAAAKYLLNYYFYQKKQLGFVRSQLIAMAVDDSAAKRILEQISAFEKKYPAEQGLQQLKATMLQRLKQYDQAFEIYKRLGQLSRMQQFALQTKAAGAYRWAVEAYHYLMDRQNRFNLKNTERLNLASTLFLWAQKLRQQGQDGSDKLNAALSELIALSSQTRDRSARLRSLVLQADIQNRWFADSDQALKLYRQLITEAPHDLLSDQARLKAAAIYRKDNNLSQAARMLAAVDSKPMYKKARFELAELAYYQGRFSQALKGYEHLLENLATNDTLFNNLFSRRGFVQTFRSDSLNLATFARAELLERQQQQREAQQLFAQLARGNSALAFPSGFKAAELALQLNDPAGTIELLDSLSTRNPDHPDRDRLLLLQGRILEKQGLRQAALDHYLKLIAAYPHSFYITTARERARSIRSAQEAIPQ